MTEPAHIPLHVRKALAARTLFFEALLPDLHAIANRDVDGSALQQVTESLFTQTQIPDTIADDAVGLDEAVRSVAKRVLAHANVDADRHDRVGLLKVVRAFNRSARKLFDPVTGSRSCRSCRSGRDGQICNGKEPDDSRRVADPGLCMAEIHQFFARVKMIAETAYRSYANVTEIPNLSLLTSFNSEEKPHSLPCEFMVNGLTTFESQLDRTIELTFLPSRFDLDTYSSIFYALTHEVVCHAYAGVRASQSDVPRPTSHTSSFSDGWMDLATIRLLENASRESIRLNLPTPTLQQLDAARAFHLARGRPGSVGLNRAAIALGRETAERLLQLLQSQASLEEAETAFLRCSLTWNAGVVEREPFALERVVANLRGHLFRTGNPTRGFLDATHQIAQGGDPGRLLSIGLGQNLVDT